MSQSQYHNAQSVDWHVVAVALVAVDLLDETHKRNGCMMVVADTCSDWPLGSSTSYKETKLELLQVTAIYLKLLVEPRIGPLRC